MSALIQENLSSGDREQAPPASAAPESCLAQDFSQPDLGIPARVKVVDPLLTMGPSSPAHVLRVWGTGLSLRVHCAILRGSTVQVRTSDRILFGRVQFCLPSGTEFEISVGTLQTL
jgi:hypothetical protein